MCSRCVYLPVCPSARPVWIILCSLNTELRRRQAAQRDAKAGYSPPRFVLESSDRRSTGFISTLATQTWRSVIYAFIMLQCFPCEPHSSRHTASRRPAPVHRSALFSFRQIRARFLDVVCSAPDVMWVFSSTCHLNRDKPAFKHNSGGSQNLRQHLLHKPRSSGCPLEASPFG